jgi:hypothetical protein
MKNEQVETSRNEIGTCQLPDAQLTRKNPVLFSGLVQVRTRHGADTPAGHSCSNINEQLLALPTYVRPSWATHPSQTLAAKMAWQADRLASLSHSKGHRGRET